jgi:hypothetical protein
VFIVFAQQIQNLISCALFKLIAPPFTMNGIAMNESNRKALPLACLAVLAAAGAHPAFADDDVKFRLSGFGTVGGAMTNSDDTGFRTAVTQARGAKKQFDLGVDSKAALQGTVSFKGDFSVTAQILGIRRDDVDFDMAFEWFYAQYTGVPGLDLKAGRVVLPAFMVSDSRLVGYSIPWARVSPLVYSMMPMSNLDGGQATYRHSIGSAVLSAQITQGNTTSNSYTTAGIPLGPSTTLYLLGNSAGKSRKVLAANLSLEWGDWSARISQVKDNTHLNIAYDIPNFGTSTTLLDFKDTFQDVGVQYDNGSLVVMSEYVRRITDPAVQNSYSWYVGAGYRFDAWTPYVMVSQYATTKSTLSAIDPKTKGQAAGVRYDIAKNVALKGEFAQYKNYDGYIFTDAASPAAKGKKVNVMSLALDFVF